MNLQIIEGSNGQPAGVFIPINDWAIIKTNYPDVENLDSSLTEWQKQLIDTRLADLEGNSNSIKPIAGLFDELDRE